MKQALDDLYPRVTEAIEDAERFEDTDDHDSARKAYLLVSLLEEEIATEVSADKTQGAVARCGAVRAALKADQPSRVHCLAERYLTEGMRPEDAAEIQALRDTASARDLEGGTL